MKAKPLHIILLFSCIFIIYGQLIISLPPTTCPFSGEGDEFNTVPQLETLSENPCFGSSSRSCCKQSYIDDLNNGTDILTPILTDFFSTLSTECSNELRGFACAPCFDDSSYWTLKLTSSTYKLTLCSNFCEKLLDTCGSSTPAGTNQTVATTYTNSELFCVALFQESSNFLINVVPSSTTKGCLDRYSSLCSIDDIEYHYTECSIVNKRDLYFSWKFNSTCNGGVGLPANIRDIHCPIDCPAGQYLPLGETECVECSPGSFSLGGGYRVNIWEDWNNRAFAFESYCVDNHWERIESCNGFSLNNSFIVSNNTGMHNTKAVLDAQVQILYNGSVSFVAQVDCEYSFDRLNFYIDDDVTWIRNNLDPQKFTFNLPIGHHRLRWVYTKDFSVNYGYDRAMIYMIEVLGMSDTSDYCDFCPAGTTSGAHSTDCTECLVNTYTSEPGSSECLACPPNQYSFPGDSFCIDRIPCVEDDYHPMHTPCTAQHVRSLIYEWNDPKICDSESAASVQLPPEVPNLPCAPCNPGEYRHIEDCLTCEIGYYSTGGLQSECLPCPAGSHAPKQLSLFTWDEWPTNTTSSCYGQCGSPTWRLASNYADSGTDHGGIVDVYLSFPANIEAEPFGTVSYTFSLNCTGWCYLELRDESPSQLLYSSWNSGIASGVNITTDVFPLSTGAHQLIWKFSKLFGQRNADHAKLWNVIVEGVDRGGAGECISCPPGSYSSTPSESCEVCQPGTYSPGNATSCTNCNVNTYQNLPQQSFCKPCGHDIPTPAGSAECYTNNCKYTPPGTEDVYDLEPLALSTGMYGPVEESTWPALYYYLNPCRRQAVVNETSCLDEDGKPLDAYACEYSAALGFSVSLGRVMGFYPLPGSEKGFILSLTEGDLGCGNTNTHVPDVPRSLNVTFVCSPESGTGAPEKDGPVYVGTTYPNVCKFHLIWKSIYACPVCTEDDYETVTEACIEGSQTVRYLWKDNPPHCRGGVSLPDPVYSNCSSYIHCTTGTYLSTDGTCRSCPAGTYSLGDGLPLIPSSSTDISPYTVSCSGQNCANWSYQNYELVSGISGTSTLEASGDFKTGYNDFIEFEYQYISQGSLFTFEIDRKLVLTETDFNTKYSVFRKMVSVGVHSFRWNYTHGQEVFPGQRDNYVKIRGVKLFGVTLAATSCIQCPPGTASSDDKSECVYCPVNTQVVSGQCELCPSDKYRLPNMEFCEDKPPCTASDYIQEYPHVDNFRCGKENGVPFSTQPRQKQPYTCTGNEPASIQITECVPCPTGTLWDNARQSCQSCPSGKYLKNGAECVDADVGSAANSTLRLFTSGDISVRIPAGFKTFSTGQCVNSGWHEYPSYMDSGVETSDCESILGWNFRTEPSAFVPTISFTITLTSPNGGSISEHSSGIEVYLDKAIYPFTFHLRPDDPHNYILRMENDQTEHEITWIWSHSSKDPPLRVTLTDLQVFPDHTGSAMSQISCPPGSYSRQNTICLPCEPGWYSRGKSNECEKCPTGSVSPAGASTCTKCLTGTTSINNVCKSNCAFDVPHYIYKNATEKFDLQLLRGLIYTVVPNENDKQPISYEINICDTFISENCYEDRCNEQSYIYMYRNNDATFYPTGLGNNFVFEDRRPPIKEDDISIDNYHSFDIVYTAKSGNNIPMGCNAVKSTIEFYCSSTAGRGDLVLEQFDQCNPLFVWNTTYACPKCQDFDVKKAEGACIDGSRLVTQTFKRPCHDLDKIISEQTTTEPCQNLKVGRTTAIITVAAVLLVLLVGLALALLFFRQKRDIEVKYQLLKGENNFDDSDEGLGEIREKSRKDNDSVALESLGEGDDLPVGGDEDD